MSENSREPKLNESPIQSRLTELHTYLLRLHKALIDFEREAYEKTHGPIASSGHFLNLVMSDPWFDYLHQISRRIVKIDELMDDKETPLSAGNELWEDIRSLFQAGGEETEFMRRYKLALQKESAVVQAHFEFQRVLVNK